MARSVYDTYVPSGMPYITQRQTNWVTTTITAGQPRPQNLDPLAIEISTALGASGVYVDDSVVYVETQGYAVPFDGGGVRYKISTTPTTPPVNNAAYITSQNGRIFINDMPEINAKSVGVLGGIRKVTNGAMTGGSAVFSSSGFGFTTADIGKKVAVLGCGTFSSTVNKDSQLVGTILSIVSVNSVVLDVAATQTAITQYAVVGWDDTVTLAAACRAAATLGRFCYLPAGTYLTTDSITGQFGYSFFKLRGDGNNTVLIHAGLTGLPGTQISCVGVLPTPTWLTAPASIGDNVLQLNSAASISIVGAGGLLVIGAQDKPQYTNTGDPSAFASLQGEVARVKSFDTGANTVTLEAGIIFNYNGNTTAGLRTNVGRMDPVYDCKLFDMQIEHVSPSTNVGAFHVNWSRALRPEIKNITFKHTGAQCLPINAWVDGKAHGIVFDYIGGPEDVDPLDWGYGFNVTGSSWQCEIYDSIGYRLRHLLTSGGGSTAPGPQFIHVSNLIASGCRVNFDNHEGGRYWTIDNCHMVSGAVIPPSPVPDAPGPGFQIRIKDTVVSNCTVTGGTMGFFSPYGERVQFVNCHSYNNYVGFNILNSPGTKILNCSATNYQTCGILIQRDSASALSYMPGIEVRHVRLYGNPTRVDEHDQTQVFEPCAVQLGWWNGAGTVFTSQYQDDWVFEDVIADGAHLKWKGLPATSYAYGALKQDTVLYESVPRPSLDNSAIAALTSGTMHLTAIDLPKGLWVTKLGTMFGSAGTTQTNLWFSLWDRNMNFLGVTSDGTTTEPTADVLTMFDVALPFVTNYDGLYYHGIMAAGAAMPSVYGQVKTTALTTLAPKLCGTSNTGLTTPGSLPAISAATSVTSQDIRDFDVKSTLTFVTQSGKAFTAGMPILISSNANPTVDFMRARVISYVSTTLKVSVYESGGSGVHIDWDITATAKATAITATANRLYAAVG